MTVPPTVSGDDSENAPVSARKAPSAKSAITILLTPLGVILFMELVYASWKPPAPIRMLTVTAIHLSASEDSFEQMDLLGGADAEKKEKQEKLAQTMM